MKHTQSRGQKRNSSSAARSDYEGQMETRLRDIGASMDSVMGKADATKKQALEELKKQQTELSRELQQVKGASEDAWGELCQGMDRSWDELRKAWDELKTASDKAASKFNH